MKGRVKFSLTISLPALLLSTAAFAQPVMQDAPAPGQNDEPAEQAEDIVVTGVRKSLESAAKVKKDAIQVVDSIVAEDIGKLPDPTTAAALQRVPGIQVSVNRNNELGDVRVRGLPDVLTTVNGRESFTTTGRRLDLQDLPAEALARIDVYKSQTPDLIEGGLAGVIDLKLNQPFNFNKPTAVITARANHGVRVDKYDPQLGLLLTRRFDTGIGEIGILANGTFSDNHYRRDITNLFGLRSAAAAPLRMPGVLIPNILQAFPEEGSIRRTQMNGSIQWRPTESLDVYIDGLYTRFRDRGARYGANTQAFTTNSTLSNIELTDDCYLARVTAAGQNPTIQIDAAGNKTLQPHTLQQLCYLESATLNNPVVNLTTQARNIVQTTGGFGGGVTWDHDGTRINLDASYQTSEIERKGIVVDIGRRVPTFSFQTNVDGIAQYEIAPDLLLDPNAMYIRNSLQQNLYEAAGSLFAAKLDAEHEFGGLLRKVKGGVRFSDRSTESDTLSINTPTPGGNIGTGTESSAVLVINTGLPRDFLSVGTETPSINNGARFLVPNPDFLLSESGLNQLRNYFRLAPGTPPFTPAGAFNADEKTYAAFGQIEYEIPLGESATIDGVIGARYVQTDRTVESFRRTTTAGVTTYTPVVADTRDRDFLPTVTARLRLDNGIQARLGYTKSIRRPEFEDLNPTVTLNLSNNPFVQSSGNAGNPDLREQKSTSYDATLEYYFRGGYVAIAGYYRKISDRVLRGPAVETFDGVEYNVTRPRNLGAATLKGVEVSGQYFFDFLPGMLSGFGAQGAFTLADSEIGGDDPLAGNPLQGVSKYNYTAGLLYDKAGISGRLIYTYRSRYFDSDQTGSISVRPIDPDRATEVYVPALLGYARPAGRLDFNIGYDISKAIRVDFGGVNILRQKTITYLGQEFQPMTGHYDETTYTLGVRVRI